MESREPQIEYAIEEKKCKAEGLTQLDIKTFQTARIIRIVWF